MVSTNRFKRPSPKTIDSAIGWLILIALGGYIFVLLGRNFEPYDAFFAQQMRAGGWILTLASWIPGFSGIVGGLAFMAIQLGEIQALRLVLSRHLTGEEFDKKLMFWTGVGLICFALDLLMCLSAWPPVNLPNGVQLMQLIRAGAFTMELLNWGNAFQIFATLFGLTIFLIAEHWIKREF